MAALASATPARAKRPVFTKARVVLLLLALGAALFGVSRAPWIHAKSIGLAMSKVELDVAGADAAPAALACALVVLCAAGLAALAKKRLALVSLVVASLAALGFVASVIAVICAPVAAASTKVAAVSGVAGESVDATLTAWVWVAFAAGMVTLVVCVAGFRPVLRLGTTSPDRVSPKASREGSPADAALAHDDDPAYMWDSLSKGHDPS